MTPALDLPTIDRLTGGRIGSHDVACPLCGPDRRSPANRRRKVLRIWRDSEGFATFNCVRCGASGRARDRSTQGPYLAKIKRARDETAEHEGYAEQQHRKARGLWRNSTTASGTLVQTYLQSRGITIEPPPTVRFLPPRGRWHPAMICAFGLPIESEPGVLDVSGLDVQAVHLTLLAPDGSRKAGTERDKIIIGSSRLPIVLAPINDGLALAITEGVEDGMSIAEAYGTGVWAAGSASRLPALADSVPDYTEAVLICADPDDAGRKGAARLADALRQRVAQTMITVPDDEWAAYLEDLQTLCGGTKPTHRKTMAWRLDIRSVS